MVVNSAYLRLSPFSGIVLTLSITKIQSVIICKGSCYAHCDFNTSLQPLLLSLNIGIHILGNQPLVAARTCAPL